MLALGDFSETFYPGLPGQQQIHGETRVHTEIESLGMYFEISQG